MTLKKEHEEDEDFDVIVKDDEEESHADESEIKDKASDAEDDAEDDEDEDDESPSSDKGEADDPIEAERRREERRKERAERRKANRELKRKREAEERAEREAMRRELAEARQQLQAVNARNLQQDARQIDTELQQATEAYNYWAQQRVKALSENNGQLFDQAEKGMHANGQRVAQLRGLQQRIAPQVQQLQQQQAPQQQAQGQAPVQLTERGKQLASDFLENIRGWYDPDGKDEDSDIVNTIDRRLVHVEGFSPNSEDYYRELKKRLAERLPHRFARATERKGPPTGGSRTYSDGSRKIDIDRQTWQAWTEAGYTEDKVKLKNMIKRYRAQQNSR